MVPPKKHLLRHQPANAQIGLMEGNTFCTTLQPRLFTMDLNVVEHKVFYTEVGGWRCGVVWMVMACVWWPVSVHGDQSGSRQGRLGGNGR